MSQIMSHTNGQATTTNAAGKYRRRYVVRGSSVYDTDAAGPESFNRPVSRHGNYDLAADETARLNGLVNTAPRYTVESGSVGFAVEDHETMLPVHASDDLAVCNRVCDGLNRSHAARVARMRRPADLPMTDLDLDAEGMDARPVRPSPRFESIEAYADLVNGIGCQCQGEQFPVFPASDDDLGSLEAAYEVKAYPEPVQFGSDPLHERLAKEAADLETRGVLGPLAKQMLAHMLRELAGDARLTGATTIAQAFDRAEACRAKGGGR